MSAGYAVLDQRSVVAVSGDDRKAFLQGLVSNDVLRVTPDHAAYALFLTPQGKFLHDFTLVESGSGEDAALLLDPETDRRADLLRRLKMYKLRSKIALEDRAEQLRVAVTFGDGALEALGLPAEPGAARPFGGGIAFTDPRLPALGARLFLPADGVAALEAAGLALRDVAEYDRLRLSLGIPDGTLDLIPEKSIPLESRMDALNAISWDKGCYMGQELTARTKYRALIKKKLFPVTIDGPAPESGTPVTLDGREAGEVRSGRDGAAIALLRLEDVQRAAETGLTFQAGSAVLTPSEPGWDRTTKG
ncbi:folate-binding protein YgfZ [Azospirillum lipoferum]|uniref:Folate-binding protein YgfZ n=1 Tax=Azospirillum lipoferum TaxID=193 RepID=A0A5A9GV72_AZOLI|nr:MULTISPECIES: folate-binding protein YgfZ [Azospirillum]KAA0598327.1 folate-binding protein YgfZ [Azospirillum lipoferum]MCP1609688.1 folate-binding protein YgfZ [Azospirillum lipoferum]MDW5535007.1 folate-binding protein YgfZ [Azospirillum sp. NL1]